MSRLAAGAASATIGACIGVGLLMIVNRPPETPELITPVAATATDETGATPVPAAARDRAPSEPERRPQPVRVIIPSIDVDADLVGLGLNPDSSMEVPDFGDAGWYTPGPVPGEPGPAVIAAHVDSVTGPDVFYRLDSLRRGDRITVEHADGSTSLFEVRRREQQLKDELPVDRIWNDTRRPVLRLITCGGQFDADQGSYRSNVIVYAVPAST